MDVRVRECWQREQPALDWGSSSSAPETARLVWMECGEHRRVGTERGNKRHKTGRY